MEANMSLVHDELNTEEYFLQISLAVAADHLEKTEDLAAAAVELLLESGSQGSCGYDGLLGGDEVVVSGR